METPTMSTPVLTRGLRVEFEEGGHVIEATVLKTHVGYGYSVLTDTGRRRLIEGSRVFVGRS